MKFAPIGRAPLLCVLALLLLSATAATARASFGDRTLRKGSHGHDVRVLQSWLTHLGVRTTVDGAFGRGTRRSVRRFERRHGLRVDGLVSRREAALMRRLISAPPASVETPIVPGAVAQLTADGRTAAAPAEAPEPVKAVIAAANEITNTPYRYGGGHGKGFDDTAFDCSGSVSHALHGGNLLTRPLDSSQLEHWGRHGRGAWITVYANSGHAYMTVAGLRFDTSGAGEDGPRWRPTPRSGHGYVARHPVGL